MFGQARSNFPKNINDPKKKLIGEWKRKTESEIYEAQKEIQKSAYNLVMPLGVLIVLFFLVYVAKDAISQKYLVYCYLLPIFAFILTFLLQIIRGRSFGNSPRIKICEKCLKEDWLGQKRCHCGGTMEPPEFYNFIETGK